ncbi:PTS system mannose/fructose/N-acetylgalactosamine-transporter subunit IIB [Lentzea sp. NPDC051213]|uniref:PTS system mannose/fructose/N-acetylgalactosamine-transporter subunit IIB n=1 Tax=Lentzea sp. NPDC051213 TaxID=3364126 RepID=UPI003788D8F0
MTGVHLRVDNRLIHGQVTVAWTGSLGVHRLVVCNDGVAGDELQRMLLPQAARGLPTEVLTVAEAVTRDWGDDVMVIAKDPDDAFRLVEGGVRPGVVNVGNVAPRPGTNYTMVTRSIAVTVEDAAGYRRLAAAGVPVVAQLMPRDKPADFTALLDRKGL